MANENLTPKEKMFLKFKNNFISKDELLLNLLYNITDRTKIDNEFFSSQKEKCGVSTFLKLKTEKENASPIVKNEIEKILARPSKQKFYDTPSGKFRIHFDTTGTHTVYQPTIDVNPQNGIPDYVDRTAEIFDFVWNYEIDSMGYDIPAPDGTNGGGNDLFDVYMHKWSGTYGSAYPENFIPGYLGRGGYTSYLWVDPNYDGFGYPDRTVPMKVTAAHEFFHCVQFVYNANAGSWLLELSSTWIEDILYDNINDYYAYLSGGNTVFTSPHLSLTTENGLHEYSACVFGHYVSENFGVSAMQKIWEETIGQDGLSAVDSAMTFYNTNAPDIFAGYCVWKYLTGNRANASHPHFQEATSYPKVRIQKRFSSLPIDATNETYPSLENYATYYLTIVGNHQTGNFQLGFNDPMEQQWRGKMILDSARNFESISFNVFDGLTISDWQNLDSIIFIPANTEYVGNNFLFGLTGVFEPTNVSENNLPTKFSLQQNFPNPFNPNTKIKYEIAKSGFVSLKIYDILGREIKTLVNENKNVGTYEIDFDANNLNSGIYFYKLTTNNFSEMKKMILVK